MSVYTFTYTYVWTYIYVYTRISTGPVFFLKPNRLPGDGCSCAYVHLCVYVCVCMCICVCVYVCVLYCGAIHFSIIYEYIIDVYIRYTSMFVYIIYIYLCICNHHIYHRCNHQVHIYVCLHHIYISMYMHTSYIYRVAKTQRIP